MSAKMYSRNSLKSWFADVGFIYLIVVGILGVIFLLLRILEQLPIGF